MGKTLPNVPDICFPELSFHAYYHVLLDSETCQNVPARELHGGCLKQHFPKTEGLFEGNTSTACPSSQHGLNPQGHPLPPGVVVPIFPIIPSPT